MLYCPQDNFGDGLGNDTLVELCPSRENPAAFFTQIILNGNLVIPPQKPPKTHIVTTTRNIKLNDVEIITVTLPDGTVAGRKILVSGMITIGVQYIADVPSQKVHFFQTEIPFNAIVVGDCGELIPMDALCAGFVAHVCVEKMRFTQIDNRTISKEIVLMIWVEERPDITPPCAYITGITFQDPNTADIAFRATDNCCLDEVVVQVFDAAGNEPLPAQTFPANGARVLEDVATFAGLAGNTPYTAVVTATDCEGLTAVATQEFTTPA